MGYIVPPPYDAPQEQWDAYVKIHQKQSKLLLSILGSTVVALIIFTVLLLSH
jgi:hypothetical protein